MRTLVYFFVIAAVGPFSFSLVFSEIHGTVLHKFDTCGKHCCIPFCLIPILRLNDIFVCNLFSINKAEVLSFN